MKLHRPLLLSLPLLLAGCSSLPHVSWSSLSPFHWFGSSRTVSDRGVGEIGASTALNQSALDKALDGDYRLRSGMETRQGAIVTFFQALKGDELRLTISGSGSRVERVEVTDPDIKSEWGVGIGSRFSDTYTKAFNSCHKGTGSDRDAVVCQAAQSSHVSYVYTGMWHGPEELMPSDDSLHSWQVSKIVWQSASAQ